MSSWRLRDQSRWMQRLIRAGLTYAFVLLALVALNLSPSALLLGAFFLTAVATAGFFSDRFSESRGEPWVSGGQSTIGLARGSDHRTVALGHRLAARNREPGQREHLAAELQSQLRLVLIDQVQRERGRNLRLDPDAAHDLLPPELAAIVTGPVDPRLTDARYLSAILDRIESP